MALGGRLAYLVQDRASPADALLREASETLFEWVMERPLVWSWTEASVELEAGWADFVSTHSWRGPVALWVDSLRRTVRAGQKAGHPAFGAGARQVLGEEIGLWLGGLQRGGAAGEIPGSGIVHAGGELPEGGEAAQLPTWDGQPLAQGARMPSRSALARKAIEDLERGESILVCGFSETVIGALCAAHKVDLAPTVILGEGSGDASGRRMARRLADDGLPVRMVYDSALFASLPHADRVWFGAEAIGSEAWLARVGSGALIEEARRLDVPVEVLATSDKLIPGGALELPAWGVSDRWMLWEDPPPGVELEAQPYEAVPLDSAATFVSEVGRESGSELALRSLRTEPVAPCCAPEA